MVSKSFVVAVAAAGCVAANPGPSPTEAAQYTGYTPHMPKWASTVPPEKLSSLQADMHSLGSSIKGNKLYTSMTAVMATAIPSSFKDAIMTNPQSIHKQYKTEKPEWYKAIPSDVRSFMEDNRHKAKSIFTHDIGPMPTHTKHMDASATGEHDKNGKSGSVAAASATGKKSTSEADSIRVFGAACGALFGAFGVAVLLL